VQEGGIDSLGIVAEPPDRDVPPQPTGARGVGEHDDVARVVADDVPSVGVTVRV
jgi:hypothetical protein